MSEINWNHGQKWNTFDHKSHCGVEVQHHSVLQPEDWGGGEKHCWCVYAIIVEGHPLFSEIASPGNISYGNKAIDDMPLHGGCTYHQWDYYVDHKGETKIAKKVGCDYQHYGDEHFGTMAPEDMATNGRVFHDAARLLDYLREIAPSPTTETGE